MRREGEETSREEKEVEGNGWEEETSGRKERLERERKGDGNGWEEEGLLSPTSLPASFIRYPEEGGERTGGFIKKLGGLQAAEFFFLTGKKFFSSWRNLFGDLELKPDDGRMDGRGLKKTIHQ